MLQSLGFGVLLPAAVAAALLLPLRFRSQLSEGPTRLFGGMAIALGFVAGYFGLGNGPLKPDTAWHWLPWIGVGAAIAGIVPRPWVLATALRIGYAALTAWLLVPVRESTDEWRVPARVLLGLAVFLLWTADRPPPARWNRVCALLLAVIAGAGAGVIMIGATGTFAELTGVIAATLVAAAIIPSAGHTPAPGAAPVAAVLLPGLLATGRFESHLSVPPVCYALPVVAALFLDLAISLPPGRRLRAVFLVFVCLAVAVGLALWAEPIDWKELFPPAEVPEPKS